VKPLRLLLVDDHAAVRTGVRVVLERQLDWKVCGEAGTGRQAVLALEGLKPDVMVLDITLPELSGFEVIRLTKKASPETEVVVFTGHEMEDLVHQAFDAGVRSFILKSDENVQLVEAVRAAAEHRPYFTPWISGIIFARFQRSASKDQPPAPGSVLGPREREAIQFIAEGKTNKELATQMGVCIRTAESHRAAIMRKLGLHSLGELIRYAIRNGIINP
jgi:two-component system, NarL family, response regulator NreC